MAQGKTEVKRLYQVWKGSNVSPMSISGHFVCDASGKKRNSFNTEVKLEFSGVI